LAAIRTEYKLQALSLFRHSAWHQKRYKVVAK